MRNKIFKFIIQFGVSLSFVLWIAFKINWSEALHYLGKIKPIHIIAYLATIVVGIAISAYKWKILAEQKKINGPYVRFFKLYLAGSLINNFMPSFVGGDAYRSYQTGKINNNHAAAASAVLADRFTGLIGAMLLALVFSALNYKKIASIDTLFLMNFGVIISIMIIVLLLKFKESIYLKNSIKKIMPKLIIEIINEIYLYKRSKKIFLMSITWSVIFSIIGVAAANFMLFKALGIEIRIIDYLSVIFFISLISAVPVTVNNIGIKEWAYINLFAFFGVQSAAVVVVAIMSRFMQLALSLLALPILVKSKTH